MGIILVILLDLIFKVSNLWLKIINLLFQIFLIFLINLYHIAILFDFIIFIDELFFQFINLLYMWIIWDDDWFIFFRGLITVRYCFMKFDGLFRGLLVDLMGFGCWVSLAQWDWLFVILVFGGCDEVGWWWWLSLCVILYFIWGLLEMDWLSYFGIFEEEGIELFDFGFLMDLVWVAHADKYGLC